MTTSRARTTTAGLLGTLLILGVGCANLPAAALAEPAPNAPPAALCPMPAAGSRSVGVPAYIWDTATWQRQLGPDKPGFIIFNPSSGPGSARDPHFLAQAQAASAAGACLLGYVRTDYGRRSVSEVQSEIEDYRRWYGVTSIFFDEASYQQADLAYYSGLAGRVRRQAGAKVALNPGMVPSRGYADVADLLVTFEGRAADFAAWTPPAWSGVRAHQWHLIYGADAATATSVLKESARRGGDVVYLTDDDLDNPWDSLPSYWGQELLTVAGTGPAAAAVTGQAAATAAPPAVRRGRATRPRTTRASATGR